MRYYFLVAVLLLQSHVILGNETDTPNDALSYIENEERLAKIVRIFKDSMQKESSWTRREYKKFLRLLKKESVDDQKRMINMLRASMGYQEFSGFEADYVIVDGVIKDVKDTIVVYGKLFDGIEHDPTTFSVEDISFMRGIRISANKLYRDGKYDEAYPLLLELAKRGFKDAQSRLAYIFFTGTENVEKSNLRALGWLGSAAHGRTEPAFKVLFNKYIQAVPENMRPTVDRVVDGYQQAYSHSDHLNCSTDHKYAKGVVKKTFCRFRLEAIAEACGIGGMRCWADKVNVDET